MCFFHISNGKTLSQLYFYRMSTLHQTKPTKKKKNRNAHRTTYQFEERLQVMVNSSSKTCRLLLYFTYFTTRSQNGHILDSGQSVKSQLCCVFFMLTCVVFCEFYLSLSPLYNYYLFNESILEIHLTRSENTWV